MRRTEKQGIPIVASINSHDWLLILGFCLSPMTGLRMGKMGPGELLVFLWSLEYIKELKISKNIISTFYMVFLITMLFGTMWCMFVAPEEIAFSHWPSWLFLSLMAMAMYYGIQQNDVEYNKRVFDIAIDVTIIWYIALYLFSRFIHRSFLGAPLWYYNRFSGGGTNPHQIGLMMCALVFCFFRRVVLNEKRVISIIFTCASFFLMQETKSSTGIASIALGVLVFVAFFVANAGINKTTKVFILMLECMLGLFFVLMFYEQLYVAAYEWVASDPNGLERFTLFSNIKNSFFKSPIVGLGPGNHSRTLGGNVKEYHNTYLEILAASGIIGAGAFINFTLRLFRRLLVDYTLIPIIVCIYGYGAGGFSLRRLPFWFFVVFCLVIAEQRIAEQNILI